MATKQTFFKFYRKKHPDISSCIAAVKGENKVFKKTLWPLFINEVQLSPAPSPLGYCSINDIVHQVQYYF